MKSFVKKCFLIFNTIALVSCSIFKTAMKEEDINETKRILNLHCDISDFSIAEDKTKNSYYHIVSQEKNGTCHCNIGTTIYSSKNDYVGNTFLHTNDGNKTTIEEVLVVYKNNSEVSRTRSQQNEVEETKDAFLKRFTIDTSFLSIISSNITKGNLLADLSTPSPHHSRKLFLQKRDFYLSEETNFSIKSFERVYDFNKVSKITLVGWIVDGKYRGTMTINAHANGIKSTSTIYMFFDESQF